MFGPATPLLVRPRGKVVVGSGLEAADALSLAAVVLTVIHSGFLTSLIPSGMGLVHGKNLRFVT